ncbi:hypothetical protein HK099_000395 [Clydaea vesicula]|uniref:Photolyase/cryptochrome alpha/beta domain-containing protein n=1 Tax=Clydaea vesicula TaxID=447962 RepID=A0AAD5TY21_9FUNG|nr:hypothetical protein HK099_000395 [Clydaea vesicula]
MIQDQQNLLEFLNLPSFDDQHQQSNDLDLWLNANFETYEQQTSKPDSIHTITDSTNKSTSNASTHFSNTKNNTSTAESVSSFSEDALDKRKRNTAASARFRAKKKIKDAELKKNKEQMEVKIETLEKKIAEQELGLRLLDNKALIDAINEAKGKDDTLFPIFFLDSNSLRNNAETVSANRWNFLLETLNDLNQNLEKLNSKLLVVRGDPIKVFPKLLKTWKISHLFFEKDFDPYSMYRDEKIATICKEAKVKIYTAIGHTIYDPHEVFKRNFNKVPATYNAFLKVIGKLPKPSASLQRPKHVPKLGVYNSLEIHNSIKGPNLKFDIPSMKEMGFDDFISSNLHIGGETEALKRLEKFFQEESKVLQFEKPKTSPTTYFSTTILSPYFSNGSLSAKVFFERINILLLSSNKRHSNPPVSLLGQILWREFYYVASTNTPNYDRMQGNPICLQIDWKDNEEYLKAWTEAKTGFPWIDAIMTQLRVEGWIHHLARHSVACFLTRGQLYVSWEKGVKVFEELLIDADWSVNNGNWMWVSASAFFHAYFRVYSPITFGKKYDKKGDFIKKYIPQLKNFPKEFIYEPWKAPLNVQEKAKCIIGVDYPNPIVDHEVAKSEIMKSLKNAYAVGEKGDPNDVDEIIHFGVEDEEDTSSDINEIENTEIVSKNKRIKLEI